MIARSLAHYLHGHKPSTAQIEHLILMLVAQEKERDDDPAK